MQWCVTECLLRMPLPPSGWYEIFEGNLKKSLSKKWLQLTYVCVISQNLQKKSLGANRFAVKWLCIAPSLCSYDTAPTLRFDWHEIWSTSVAANNLQIFFDSFDLRVLPYFQPFRGLVVFHPTSYRIEQICMCLTCWRDPCKTNSITALSFC